MVVTDASRRFFAVTTLPARSERTQLSASALYARNISFENSEVILRPLAKELLKVNMSDAKTASPVLTMSLIR